MKKKVVIEKVPSSKKKVVIEGLPKAQYGITTTGRDPLIVQQTQNLLMDKIKKDNEKSKLGITSSARPQDYDLMMQNQKMLQDKIQADNAKIKGGFKKFGDTWKNTKFQVPHFYPTMGNQYLQGAMMDLNDAFTYASNIGKSPKDITIPSATYNPYANIYWGEAAYGGELPIASGGMETNLNLQQAPTGFTWGQSFSQEGTPTLPQTDGNKVQLPTQDNYNIDLGELGPGSTSQGGNKLNNIMSGIAAGAKLLSATTKGVKGGLDIAGSMAQNKAAQLAENQKYTSSVFSDAMATPYETQGHSFQGRNPIQSADGMQIKEIGGMGEPNIVDAPELNGYFRRKKK